MQPTLWALLVMCVRVSTLVTMVLCVPYTTLIGVINQLSQLWGTTLYGLRMFMVDISLMKGHNMLQRNSELEATTLQELGSFEGNRKWGFGSPNNPKW